MKVAIIQFPGSSCEREVAVAIRRAGMEPVHFLWNEATKKIEDCEGYVIVSGFSFKDKARAGVISGQEGIIKFIKQQAEKVKPILGIASGAQLLVEAGLIPGLPKWQRALALAQNKRIKFDKVQGVGFYNNWVHISASSHVCSNAFTIGVSNRCVLRVPVAHTEGRFVMPEKLLKELQATGQIAYQYCDQEGRLSKEFPVNPNGSMDNIAAITNYAGNVMAMMPHPERSVAGDVIFQSMRDYVAEKEEHRRGVLSYQVAPNEIVPFKTKVNQLLLDAVADDCIATSVQIALEKTGIPVTIKRLMHWEVDCSKETMKSILETEVLYNPRSTRKTDLKKHKKENTAALLIRQIDDSIALQKFQLLANHYEIDGVKKLNQGVLWLIEAEEGDVAQWVEKIIKLGVLFNPISEQCYYY